MNIFHVALREDWDAAVVRGSYVTSTRGATIEEVGFIHFSYAHQLADVAELVYDGEDAELCVLVVDPDAVRADGTPVVDEDGGDGALFPHVYGPIDPSLVTEVRAAGFDPSGRFRF